MRLLYLLPVLFVFTNLDFVSADIVSFGDTEFPTANWSAAETSATSNNPDVVHTQQLTGGNPAAFRQLDVSSSDFNSVHSGLFHFSTWRKL